MKLNTLILREIMENKGVNQSWLARMIGVERATVSLWMKKPESVRMHRITDIANVLGIDPLKLIGY
jgi:transcriptional regulator with XRE-family HTH domain